MRDDDHDPEDIPFLNSGGHSSHSENSENVIRSKKSRVTTSKHRQLISRRYTYCCCCCLCCCSLFSVIILIFFDFHHFGCHWLATSLCTPLSQHLTELVHFPHSISNTKFDNMVTHVQQEQSEQCNQNTVHFTSMSIYIFILLLHHLVVDNT